MAPCKACGATIKWILTENKRNLCQFRHDLPVDAKPVTVITSLGKTIKAFVPHWASCPGAEMFRKK